MTALPDLLLHEISDLYDAEHRILQALPKMAKKAKNPQLKKGFRKHLAQTKEHVKRLEGVFSLLGKAAKRQTCDGIIGLLKEGDHALTEPMSSTVRDAALISAAQRVEHYEMAGYGCARTYARMLGHRRAAQVLQKTLNEEGATDKKLTDLAEQGVNKAAMTQGRKKVGKKRAGLR